jgi:hypothetical protein
MTDDAKLAFHRNSRAGSTFLKMLNDKLGECAPSDRPKLHLMAHSAGSIWMGHLMRRWQSLGGGQIDSLQLFAPACTMESYRSHIAS